MITRVVVSDDGQHVQFYSEYPQLLQATSSNDMVRLCVSDV